MKRDTANIRVAFAESVELDGIPPTAIQQALDAVFLDELHGSFVVTTGGFVFVGCARADRIVIDAVRRLNEF